ncbi:hypothetical protein MD484_g1145, partial [Candolleomyces efflorescens]
MSLSSNQLQSLLGVSPSSSKLSEYLTKLSDGKVADPEVKSYPDAVYFNYYDLGLSLLFTPQKGYKPKVGLKNTELETQKLVLDSLDLYNVPKPVDPAKAGKTGSSRSEIAFTTFPATPVTLTLVSVQDKDGKNVSRPQSISISTASTGKELVSTLGEPDRKGGGAGPSSGSIGIWCEWSKDGLMIEFGGDDARGPGAWERGKDAVWKVITLFQPKNP